VAAKAKVAEIRKKTAASVDKLHHSLNITGKVVNSAKRGLEAAKQVAKPNSQPSSSVMSFITGKAVGNHSPPPANVTAYQQVPELEHFYAGPKFRFHKDTELTVPFCTKLETDLLSKRNAHFAQKVERVVSALNKIFPGTSGEALQRGDARAYFKKHSSPARFLTYVPEFEGMVRPFITFANRFSAASVPLASVDVPNRPETSNSLFDSVNQQQTFEKLRQKNIFVNCFTESFDDLEQGLIILRSQPEKVFKLGLKLIQEAKLHHKKTFKQCFLYTGRIELSSAATYKSIQRRCALWMYRHDYLQFPFRKSLIIGIQKGDIQWDHIETWILDKAFDFYALNYILTDINALLFLFNEFAPLDFDERRVVKFLRQCIKRDFKGSEPCDALDEITLKYFWHFLYATAKTEFDKQRVRIYMFTFLFLTRISELVNLKWRRTLLMTVRSQRVVRIILNKAKNLRIGSRCQITQIPELSGDLDPVSIYHIQKDYVRSFESSYVFVNESGSKFSTDELSKLFKLDYQRFLDFMKPFPEYHEIKSLKITFGSIRKSGMSLLACTGQFLSHEICWLSRHSNKGRGHANTVVLDSYANNLFFDKMIHRYKHTMETLFPNDDLPTSVSNPPYVSC